VTARSFLIEVELGGIQLSVRLQIGPNEPLGFSAASGTGAASSERIIVAAPLVEHLFSLRVISLWKNDRQRGFLVGP
jgi:hypothetical protein